MRLFARLPAAALVLLAALLAVPAAYAQGTTVSLSEPLVDFVAQMLMLVISGVIAVFLPVILTRLASRYGLQIEQEKRDALQTTLTNAAGGLIQRLGEEARSLKVDMKNPAVADAVRRALDGAPDALKWAGLTEEEIARRILEKIPQIEGGGTVRPLV